jgi:diadenosine tetraphosphate (Ap4A) HIT family hydrolase
MNPNCLTCEVLSGKRRAPGGTIFQDALWEVGSVLAPVLVPGYLIVNLRRHCEDLKDLTPDEAAALGSVLRTTCAAIHRVLAPPRIHVASYGEAIRHIHFHVIPRHAGMPPGSLGTELYIRWRRLLYRMGRKAIAVGNAAEIVAQIQDAFDRIR